MSAIPAKGLACAISLLIFSNRSAQSTVDLALNKGDELKKCILSFMPIARAHVVRFTRAIPRSTFAAPHDQNAKIR
jgi:hypothetical protein